MLAASIPVHRRANAILPPPIPRREVTKPGELTVMARLLMLVMAALFSLQVAWSALAPPLFAQAAPAAAPATSQLDYDVFKAKVQPIFLTARPANGNARCVACHSRGGGAYLEPVPPGATTWTE